MPVISDTPAEELARLVTDRGGPEALERATRTPVLVAPDALTAAASYVQRVWGHDRYRLGIVAGSYGNVLLKIVHIPDGTAGYITADRFGNVAEVSP